VTHWEERVAAVILGLLLGWLGLLETGLADRSGLVAVVLSVVILAGSVALAWVFVRWWVRLDAEKPQ
jgi:hypothetical protein